MKYTKEEINAKMTELQTAKNELDKELIELGKQLAITESTFNQSKEDLLSAHPEYAELINSDKFDEILENVEKELDSTMDQLSAITGSTQNEDSDLPLL